jgi:hypothetical protein
MATLETNFGKVVIDVEALVALGYGLEAIKRLKAGRSTIYGDDGIVIEEYPDGRRFEMALDERYRAIAVRELTSAPR